MKAFPFVVFITLGASLAASQETATPTVTTRQATFGKAEFARACARCHMSDLSGANEVPPLAGQTFMTTWGERTTKELFDYISGAMPPGGPAQTAETYEAIIAYILQSNGAVEGTDVTRSTEAPIGRLVSKTSR